MLIKMSIFLLADMSSMGIVHSFRMDINLKYDQTWFHWWQTLFLSSSPFTGSQPLSVEWMLIFSWFFWKCLTETFKRSSCDIRLVRGMLRSVIESNKQVFTVPWSIFSNEVFKNCDLPFLSWGLKNREFCIVDLIILKAVHNVYNIEWHRSE